MSEHALSPEEARALWVRALRSGKFKQGEGQLAAGDKRCCLGVAADLAVEHGVIKGYNHGYGTLNDGPDVQPVQDWLGLLYGSGAYGGCGNAGLALSNDNGATFAEIADIIEAEPEGLFR